MLPVSVCMIAKNEDNHIEECLKRLRPCRFEVIVVDTGSVDRTVETAQKYTDKVFHFAWCDDFSAARNFSIQQASNDWVLVIDCDEYLENVNLAELEDALEANSRCVGMIVRNNPYSIQGVRSIMSERIFLTGNTAIMRAASTSRSAHWTAGSRNPSRFPSPSTMKATSRSQRSVCAPPAIWRCCSMT